MILSIRVNNFLVYSNGVELSLLGDMRIKKFGTNIYSENNFNILKTVCIYGANNSGKTCAVRAINSIKNVLLSRIAEVPFNIYTNSHVCSFGITFIHKGHVYSYDYKFDSTIVNNYVNGFVYEELNELSKDKYGNSKKENIFIRDVVNSVYSFPGNEELEALLGSISCNNILVYTINSVKYPIIEKYKQIFIEFANKIEVLDMNNIPLEKTIEVLKNDNGLRSRTVELIKTADLNISDYKYVRRGTESDYAVGNNMTPQEIVLRASKLIEDMTKLVSVHRGKEVPSMTYDSTGTKKIVSIASYIVEALGKGKILVIDELDSSLHFKLTRALVALFNNEKNINAQLIFTAHDVTLLDCKKLFRKDQIWFAAKDETGEYLYPLADFTAKNDDVRSISDIADKYREGVFGAVPEPDFLSILLGEKD